jgi:hypothetical protein
MNGSRLRGTAGIQQGHFLEPLMQQAMSSVPQVFPIISGYLQFADLVNDVQKHFRLATGPLACPFSIATYFRAQPTRNTCSTCSDGICRRKSSAARGFSSVGPNVPTMQRCVCMSTRIRSVYATRHRRHS